MAIDILNIEKSKIKPGLEGKIILLSGEKKTGKTTFLSELPDCLIIGLEPGTNLLSGVTVQPCNTWTEFKQIVKQLKSDEAKKKYKYVGIDPLGILWNLAAKFTWMQKNDGSDLSDYEIGLHQNKSMNEFSSAIMDIAREGYGLVMISHITTKDLPNDLGFKYGVEIAPDLPKRPRSFVEGLADLTINVIAEPTAEGKTIPYMYLRETIENGIRVKAGGRYKDLPEKAVFNYNNLVKIIEEADKKLAESGADMSGTKTSVQETIVDPSVREWTDVVKDVNETLKLVAEKTNKGDKEISGKVKAIISSYLGEGKKITEAQPNQIELVEAALADLKTLVA
jgi:hypothetical protein